MLGFGLCKVDKFARITDSRERLVKFSIKNPHFVKLINGIFIGIALKPIMRRCDACFS